MKKKILGISITLVLVTLLVFGAWQYLKKGIELEKVTADMHFKGQDQLTIDMRILIDTRFFWDTKIYGVKYQLKLADRVILDGEQEFDTLVIDNNETSIPLDLTLNPKEIRSTIDSLQVTDSTYLTFEYRVDYHMPIIGRRQTEKTSLKKIEVPIPPEITLHELKVEKIKLTEPLELLAQVKLVNRGKTALTISDLEYSFLVENQEWASGKRTEPIRVKSADEQIIDLPFKVSPENVGKRLWQRFIKRNSIQYSILANGRLDLKVKKLDVQKIDFELNGVY